MILEKVFLNYLDRHGIQLNIDESTGELTFINAANFEDPLDAEGSNTYKAKRRMGEVLM